MRLRWAAVATGFTLFLSVAMQGQPPKREPGSQPLTAEQIAVYRAVLENYTKHSDGGLNLANQTVPLDGRSLDLDCTRGIALEVTHGQDLTVHAITTAVTVNPRILLVDPDRQQRQVEENDPQNLMKRAIDGHEEVSDTQVEISVKKAFETGLFTLSEIVFDKSHRHAVVSYSFVCGGLCGNGSTLVLTRLGRKWRVTKRCSTWVS